VTGQTSEVLETSEVYRPPAASQTSEVLETSEVYGMRYDSRACRYALTSSDNLRVLM